MSKPLDHKLLREIQSAVQVSDAAFRRLCSAIQNYDPNGKRSNEGAAILYENAKKESARVPFTKNSDEFTLLGGYMNRIWVDEYNNKTK